MKYRTVIERTEDGMFIAQVQEFPNCVSKGKTWEEAIDNIESVVDTYLENLGTLEDFSFSQTKNVQKVRTVNSTF